MMATFVIACIIFPMIATPLNKQIDRRVTNKVLSYLIQFLIDAAILLSLYGIAALFGLKVFK